MNISEINKEIESFKNELKFLKINTEKFCQNKSIPLEERWGVFEKIGEFVGEEEGWTQHFKSLPEKFIMYDGKYHVDRHQTVYIVNVIEAIEESEDSEIDINKFKEEVLEKFIWSFTYDW